MNYIAKDVVPAYTVDKEGFRDMVHALNPRYQLQHKDYFSRIAIPSLYEETRQNLTVTVQFNYNFTLAWYSMHDVLQVFVYKIQKIAMCIIISMRRDVSFLETTRGICSKHVITQDVAVEVPISWSSMRISVGV